MMRTSVVAWIFVAALGCSGNNNSNAPGTGGSTAATAGTGGAATGGTGGTSAAGAGGTSTGGTGGASTFTSVLPCTTESDYMTGTTTVNFGLLSGGFAYAPKCLKVSAGTTVTFSGDFGSHPLEPSALRGTLTGNPITSTSAGTTASFTFPAPGFYAYFCQFHDSQDTGNFMSGVIWVQ